MTFRPEGTRGWLMAPKWADVSDVELRLMLQDGCIFASSEQEIRAELRRRSIQADPDPKILSALIERGRVET